MKLKSMIAGLMSVAAVCGLAMLVSAASEANAQQSGKQPGWWMWGPGHHWRHGWRHEHMTPRHRHRMQRHWTFMNGNIPARFQNLRNPLEETDEVINAGGALYTTHCASCHGTEGMGEGESGNDLFPSPALLALLIQMPIAVDSYLMWTISEGGKDFNTAMPAFKDTISDEDRWRIISYMRNGFALP
jgi:mono/diheme cytochrome c family protein